MRLDSNVIEFGANLRQFSEALRLKESEMIRAIVFELLRRIILRTPVDRGQTAAAWSVSSGSIGAESVGVTEKLVAINDVASRVSKVTFDPPQAVYWIYNNLPQAHVLEFGLYPKNPKRGSRVDATTRRPIRGRKGKNVTAVWEIRTVEGYSKQAPQGMVRVTVAEVESELFDVIGGLEKWRTG